jgi:Ran GTPase-activating protein (RanGAP) involved in mRNA processing and transport
MVRRTAQPLRRSPLTRPASGVEDFLVNYNNIGDAGAVAVAAALADNKQLTWLELSNNPIGDEGAAALGEALRVNRKLERLGVTCCSFGGKGAVAIANGLRGNTAFRRLELGAGCDLGDDAMVALADVLRGPTGIEQLAVSDSKWGARGAAALGDALRSNSTLTYLYLPDNIDSGAEGAVALAGALSVNETLTTLILDGCGVGDEGAAAFGQALAANKALKELNLDRNGIKDDGAAKLADGLRSATAIEKLTLDRNEEIGTIGGVALADALKANKSLVELKLRWAAFELDAATAFAEALRENATIAAIDICFSDKISGASEEEKQALRNKITECSDASAKLPGRTEPANIVCV